MQRRRASAPQGEPQLGLRVVPFKSGLMFSKRKRLDRLRAHLFAGGYSRGFAFVVGKGHPSEELFHTSPEIRQALEKHPEWAGRPTGSIVYEIHPRRGFGDRRFNRKYPEYAFPKKTMYTQAYYPFIFPNERGAASLDVWDEMTHHGIATDLEAKTMELMAKKYPDYSFTPHGQNTEPRYDQIKRFGLTKRWYAPGEYARVLRGVVERERGKHQDRTENPKPERPLE
jgi:hypothetical protein